MPIDNTQDMIDMWDITDRVDELRGLVHDEDGNQQTLASGEYDELELLEGLLAELAGYGGDHDWGGDWYPGSLIRDSYFVTYAQEFADDIGAINSEAGWPTQCIDWGRAARELQMDYSIVDYDGTTYWYR